MAKGLYNKYTVVTNSTGEKVDGCFVLRPETDPVALKALRTYASFTTDIELAADLIEWITLIEKGRAERR